MKAKVHKKIYVEFLLSRASFSVLIKMARLLIKFPGKLYIIYSDPW